MQQSPFNLHQPGLVLLIGLAGSTLPGVSRRFRYGCKPDSKHR